MEVEELKYGFQKHWVAKKYKYIIKKIQSNSYCFFGETSFLC